MKAGSLEKSYHLFPTTLYLEWNDGNCMTENITQFWNSPGAYLKVKFETEKVCNSTNIRMSYSIHLLRLGYALGNIHDSDIGCNDEFTYVGAKIKVKIEVGPNF